METMYFVSWYIHNKTSGWQGTIVDKYDSLALAKKEYHRQLSMYIADDQFDSVAVFVTNSTGGTDASDYWTSIKAE